MTSGPAPRRLLVPVPTGTEAAAFDAAAREAGTPGKVLMESAGRAAADVAQAMTGSGGLVVVLAGAGNNGGDAVVLARTLHARGVDVLLLVDPRRPSNDALLHGHRVPSALLPTATSPSDGGDAEARIRALVRDRAPALLVDGLLGTGLADAPREPVAGWIRGLNGLAGGPGGSIPVLALDLPSGVVADTGQAPGAVVAADLTVAFGAPKLGTLLHPGRGRAGRLVAVEIGFPPWEASQASAALVTGRWAHAHLPRRSLDTHKNAVGRLLLICGDEAMGGAAVLTARAALRTGVGMLRVLCAPRHRDLFHHQVPEAILPDPTDRDAVRDAVRNSDAVAAGPGMGLAPEGLPARLLPGVMEQLSESGGGALLLDADALTLLGRGALPPLPRGDGDRCLLTPHPGELSRILGEETVPGLAPMAARRAAERWGATCLLKGAPSVVASPGDAPVRISASGGSAFARGGMGDVLTGVSGALLARGLAAADAAALALHLTGRAADHFLHGAPGRRSSGDALLPSDLVDELAGVLAEVEGWHAPDAGGPMPGEGPDLSRVPGVLLDLGASR
ncbi:MAG: NAD(P)H-hydrate dehydratase [Gemmatimonadales bacterium]|nr:MAG: NAD(P)H-hydrate dehydratase [Gemmatimonadales bacterium]